MTIVGGQIIYEPGHTVSGRAWRVLAYMLGTSRQTVSVVARQLQTKRLIEYGRGRVAVVDRRGLERVACPCCRAISDRLAFVLSNPVGHLLSLGDPK